MTVMSDPEHFVRDDCDASNPFTRFVYRNARFVVKLAVYSPQIMLMLVRR